MAHFFDNSGNVQNFDLNLPAVISRVGDQPVLYTELRLSAELGECYECNRLPGGEIELVQVECPVASAESKPGAKIVLDSIESLLVETESERTGRLLAEIQRETQLIEQMKIRDIVPGGDRYFTSTALVKTLSSRLYGTDLLIAILFAEKIWPADAWRRTGMSAHAFRTSVDRLKAGGSFDEWN